jgi:succinate dehydrogenase / fumarate reductase cytochrome b subunit
LHGFYLCQVLWLVLIGLAKQIMIKRIRPISPHLVIYKPQFTSVFSIFHRISGSALVLFSVTSVVITYLKFFFRNLFDFQDLVFCSFDFICFFMLSSGYFLIFLFCFHFINGFRHMLWDMGLGLNLKHLIVTGFFVFFLAGFLTIFVTFI